jgi:hypothetical protein
MIPVDYVSNGLLLATSLAKRMAKGEHFLFHSTSGDKCPISPADYVNTACAVWGKIGLD